MQNPVHYMPETSRSLSQQFFLFVCFFTVLCMQQQYVHMKTLALLAMKNGDGAVRQEEKKATERVH